MINIYELEKKWLRYKIKSYLPRIIITTVVITVLSFYIAPYSIKTIKNIINTTSSDILKNQDTQLSTQNKKVAIKNDFSNTDKKIVKDDKLLQDTAKKDNNKIVLTPSLSFIDTLENTTPKYYKKEEPTKKTVAKKQKTPNTKTQKQEKIRKTAIKKSEKKSINIERKNNQDDINYVIKRFNNNNDPQLSLFISKKYYEMKKYKKAYNYALITNKIDKNIEESWLIFSKSLVKLNKKNMSIKILKRYIQQSKSNQAKILLNDIVLGKFQ